MEFVDSSSLAEDVNPYINELIKYIEEFGINIDAASNFNSADGYKMIRKDIISRMPELANIIDVFIASQNFGKLKMAHCNSEKYCWFIRLYNQPGHFLNWHFDNNFTKGMRYTFVCNLYLSPNNTSHFLTKDSANRINVIESKTKYGILYDGSSVKHAISSQSS